MAAAALSKRVLLMLLNESFARGEWLKVERILSKCTDIRQVPCYHVRVGVWCAGCFKAAAAARVAFCCLVLFETMRVKMLQKHTDLLGEMRGEM